MNLDNLYLGNHKSNLIRSNGISFVLNYLCVNNICFNVSKYS
jgi:hypothetical protein